MRKIILPFTGKYPITQNFGVKVKYMRTGIHNGIDYGMPTGTPLIACMDGEIVECEKWNFVGYGRNFKIRSSDGKLFAHYAHCSEIFVNNGTKVKQGETLAKSGKTGYVIAVKGDGSHLHFGTLFRVDGQLQWVDPLQFINGASLPFTQKQEEKDIFEPVKTEQKIPVKNEDFYEYTVKKNDTLSAICKKELGNGNLWKKLFEYNKGTIEKPSEIYVGQIIKIPNSLKQNADNT